MVGTQHYDLSSQEGTQSPVQPVMPLIPSHIDQLETLLLASSVESSLKIKDFIADYRLCAMCDLTIITGFSIWLYALLWRYMSSLQMSELKYEATQLA